MEQTVFLLNELIALLKVAFLALAALFLVVFAIDWLVRTRRINPFSSVARFFRKTVQPVIQPIEYRVVRAGGLPSSAPWWALVAVVVTGILVLLGLNFVIGLLQMATGAVLAGPGGLIGLLVSWAFGVLQIALIVRVISSWFRLSEFSGWIRWSVVLTEPILRPIRRFLPNFGMIDISPIVAYFALRFLQVGVLSLMGV